jgi:hypothetical protein
VQVTDATGAPVAVTSVKDAFTGWWLLRPTTPLAPGVCTVTYKDPCRELLGNPVVTLQRTFSIAAEATLPTELGVISSATTVVGDGCVAPRAANVEIKLDGAFAPFIPAIAAELVVPGRSRWAIEYAFGGTAPVIEIPASVSLHFPIAAQCGTQSLDGWLPPGKYDAELRLNIAGADAPFVSPSFTIEVPEAACDPCQNRPPPGRPPVDEADGGCSVSGPPSASRAYALLCAAALAVGWRRRSSSKKGPRRGARGRG